MEMPHYDPEIMELYIKYVPMPDDGNMYILLGSHWFFKWVVYKYKCICKICNSIFFNKIKNNTCDDCKFHTCLFTIYKKYDPTQNKLIEVMGCICGIHYIV